MFIVCIRINRVKVKHSSANEALKSFETGIRRDKIKSWLLDGGNSKASNKNGDENGNNEK